MHTKLVRAPKLRPFTAITCLILLGVTSAVTACSGGAPESVSETPQRLERAGGPARVLPDKARAAKRIPKDVAGGRVVIKFHEGTGVRMRGSSLTSNGLGNLAQPASALSLAQVRSDLNRATQRLGKQAGPLGPHFRVPEATLAGLKQRGESRSGARLADLALYFDAAWTGTSRDELVALIEDLNALDSVEIAYLQPPPRPAAAGAPQAEALSSTPDFTPLQGYVRDDANGIGVPMARTFAGGRGENVKIIDIEGDWTANHEDLPPPFFYEPGPTPGDGKHGTGVAGVMVGVENDFGVTGISPLAGIGYASPSYDGVATALANSTAALDPGDVLVLEMQFGGPELNSCSACNGGCCNCVPTDYYYFDAIQTATANGITVVQAAGNGTANLDHPGYGGAFDRSFRDSGSIIVGASRSSAREAMCWSNYGSRIDLHAWGENVTTTGGAGDLYDGPLGFEDDYTDSFNGTSSATPIVAGAVALAQSIAIEASEEPFEPAEVRALLASTGKPQTGTFSQAIGVLPDLAQAAPVAAGGEGSCGNGVCDGSESCSSCASDCGTCPSCVPAGCVGASSVTVPYDSDGAVDSCVFFTNPGINVNSWNMSQVTINGVNVANAWVPSGSYPATCNGGYYLRMVGSFPWSHVELR